MEFTTFLLGVRLISDKQFFTLFICAQTVRERERERRVKFRACAIYQYQKVIYDAPSLPVDIEFIHHHAKKGFSSSIPPLQLSHLVLFLVANFYGSLKSNQPKASSISSPLGGVMCQQLAAKRCTNPHSMSPT